MCNREALRDRLIDLYRTYPGGISFSEFLEILIARMEARYGPVTDEESGKR